MVTTQAERDARKKGPPSTLVDRLWIAAFFGVGALIGVLFTIRAIDQGTPALLSIAAGATVGGIASSFLFFAFMRFLTVFTAPGKDRQILQDDDR